MQPMIEGFVRQPKGRWFKSTPRNHPNVPRVDRACQQLPFSLTHIMLGTIRFRRHHGRVGTFALLFLQRWGAEDSCSAGLPSHLRRFPLKYKTWLAPAESINPKRDRLVESHLSKNETEIQDLVSTRRIHKSQAG